MGVLLIAANWLLLVLQVLGSNNKLKWADAAIKASVLLGLLVVLSTECLSVFHAISTVNLTVFWAIAMCLQLAWLCFRKAHFAKVIADLKKLPTELRKDMRTHVGQRLFVFGILATTLLIALVAPPNNWDSLTYHMSRVAHWAQNQSLDFYATPILRQLTMPPLAEFFILHLQLLSQSDVFANSVQWLSLVGCLTGLHGICLRLHPRSQVSWISIIFCITLPVVILQCTSTQNDLHLALWLVAIVYFALQNVSKKSYPVWIGLALGLCLLTKGTAYLYVQPILLWVFLRMLPTFKLSVVGRIITIGCFALLINLGHYQRNYSLFGSPLGSQKQQYLIETVTPAAALSGIVRDASMQFAFPIASANLPLQSAVQKFHDMIGQDINDPSTTYSTTKAFRIEILANHEDVAVNPLHATLLVLAWVMLLIIWLKRKKNQQHRRWMIYCFYITSGALLLAVMLKWNPWVPRLYLPFFVLSCPVLAYALTRCLRSHPKIKRVAIYLLLLSIMPWVICNHLRPIVQIDHEAALKKQFKLTGKSIFNMSRDSLYFANHPDLYPRYQAVAQTIKASDIHNVQIIGKGDCWEYPLWVLLRTHAGQAARKLEHIHVNNESQQISETNMPSQPAWQVIIGNPRDKSIELVRPVESLQK